MLARAQLRLLLRINMESLKEIRAAALPDTLRRKCSNHSIDQIRTLAEQVAKKWSCIKTPAKVAAKKAAAAAAAGGGGGAGGTVCLSPPLSLCLSHRLAHGLSLTVSLRRRHQRNPRRRATVRDPRRTRVRRTGQQQQQQQQQQQRRGWARASRSVWR